MSKRGAFSVGLVEVGVLVLIAVVILVSLGFFKGLYDSVFGVNKDTVRNFNVLAQKINTLTRSSELFAAEKSFPFYLNNDYIIVGFNKGEMLSRDSCGVETATKPAVCGDLSCICLYKGKSRSNNEFDKAGGNTPVNCHSIPDVDYVFTYLYSPAYPDFGNIPSEVSNNLRGQEISIQNENYKAVKNAYFFLYGKCGYIPLLEASFGVNNLYMEKFTEPDQKKPDYAKTYLLVAYPDAFVLKHSESMRLDYGQKTGKEFGDRIVLLINQGDLQKAFDQYIAYRVKFSLVELPASVYFSLSDFAIGQIRVLKKDPSKKEELDSVLGNALALHLDFFAFYGATKNDPIRQKLPSIMYNLGFLYYENRDFDKSMETFVKLTESYPASDFVAEASKRIEELKLLRTVQSVDLGKAIDANNALISSMEKSDPSLMSQEMVDAVSKAYYMLGVIGLVKRMEGISLEDSDIAKNFKHILDRYSGTEYADDSCFHLAKIYESNTDTACYYYGLIVSNYPDAKNIYGDDLAKAAEESFAMMKCPPDVFDSYDAAESVPYSGSASCPYPADRISQVNPELVGLIPKFEGIMQAKLCVHSGCATSGHVSNSAHYIKSGESYCNAIDFDFRYDPGSEKKYSEQIALVEAALITLGISDNVGFGIYPDWKNLPGFHLNLGKKARWAFVNKDGVQTEVSYQAAKSYAQQKFA
jgi:tetratricopeptide (TPR) repeat protein